MRPRTTDNRDMNDMERYLSARIEALTVALAEKNERIGILERQLQRLVIEKPAASRRTA